MSIILLNTQGIVYTWGLSSHGQTQLTDQAITSGSPVALDSKAIIVWTPRKFEGASLDLSAEAVSASAHVNVKETVVDVFAGHWDTMLLMKKFIVDDTGALLN